MVVGGGGGADSPRLKDLKKPKLDRIKPQISLDFRLIMELYRIFISILI